MSTCKFTDMYEVPAFMLLQITMSQEFIDETMQGEVMCVDYSPISASNKYACTILGSVAKGILYTLVCIYFYAHQYR